jgi:hypothetical protein
VRFSAEELPDFDGATYISDRYAEPLRARYAPVIDRIGVTPYAAAHQRTIGTSAPSRR